MNIDELRDKRFEVVIEALMKGLTVPYIRGWNIFLSDGILYQTHLDKESSKQITHKSVITLQNFLNFCYNLNDKETKELFGMVRLAGLQDKLMKGSK